MSKGTDHLRNRRSHGSDKTHSKNEGKSPKSFNKRGVRNAPVIIGLLGFLLVAGVLCFVRYQSYLRNIVVTPVNAPRMASLNSTSAAVDPLRFWGSYRPNLYFGLKTRTPRSPVVGLMWLTQLTNEMPPPVRHWCNQDDRLPKYGWLKHDGKHFGIQEIEETTYTIKTEFVKRAGGQHGGDWSARISVIPKDQQRKTVVSLMFYMALDGQGSLRQKLTSNRQLTSISGYTEELGEFVMKFPKQKNTANVHFNHLISYTSRLDNLKETVIKSMKIDAFDEARTLPYFALGGRVVPKDSPAPNFLVHQITAQLPYKMEVVFESGSFFDRPDTLSEDKLTEELTSASENFNKKFASSFDLQSKGYTTKDIKFAKAALSNMVGGIGYFYGSSLVQSKYNEEPVEYWPASLYTSVPSRSFFPRGFLWDEGFHNLLISQWDADISKDIISHWLDLINTEGWIPREQILGLEARARVPDEFVVQRNTNANPPTLFLPLQRLIKQMKESLDPKDKYFLKSVFPRLKTWYGWYNTSQTGTLVSTYRWRGRDDKTIKELNPKTLTSGLDDYPRASHPTSDERHVDLRCWMTFASGLMADIAKELGENWQEYDATYQHLSDNTLLDKLHWWPKKQRYCDYGLHSEKVHLVRPKPVHTQPGQPMVLDKIRQVNKEPRLQFVDQFGYISLFPFLLKIVDTNSDKLYTILTDLKNADLLWTNYGLRSLARSASLYNKYNTQHDPPYWRGAIWININYLAVGALHHYANTPGKYQQLAQEIYTDLRKNIVSNVIKEYYRTGYIFEQYNDKTGEGKGCHPFTGWSSLVVLMMAEIY